MAPQAIDVDISSADFWSQDARQRDVAFAQLRSEAPVSFHPPPEGGMIPSTQGFWAITRREDVVHVTRHPELFCSGEGVSFDEIPAEVAEAASSFLTLDAPRHTTLRRLVSSAFTPKAVARIEEQIRGQAHQIIKTALEARQVEFVEMVAMPLPLSTISDMIGVPEQHRRAVYESANAMVAASDPDFVEEGSDALMTIFSALSSLTQIALELAEERRDDPTEDLMTGLVEARVDGIGLTDDEIAAFFVLLAVAGNDTTRNTLSHGIKAFGDHPKQWSLLRDDVDGRVDLAVEEVIRWATPVIQFRRTATADTEINGVKISKGEHVVMFYSSANRDESSFSDPWSFDISRNPNDHVGFGGGGRHFCMGASLARLQLRSVITEIANQVSELIVGPPQLLRGNFIHGIHEMPCEFILGGGSL